VLGCRGRGVECRTRRRPLRALRSLARGIAITLSGAFKRILVERYRLAPWQIDVIPPGVDLAKFCPGDRAAARARFGIGSDVWLACSVRRLVPRTGVDVLLRAWAALGRRDRLLAVAGEGPERGRLERMTSELGIRDCVCFLGSVDEEELVELYRAADVSVAASTSLEGFGLIVLESLACGTPVVVSAVGGLPEAVERLEPPVVVPPGDPAALAERLSGPLPDRDKCRAYAEGYSWPAAAQRHVDLYDRVVHGQRERKLRVVYLDHTAKLSGAEIALLRLLPALTGVEPHVILSEEGPLVGRLLAAGVSAEVLPLGRRAANLPRERVRSAALVSRESMDAAVYSLRLAFRLRRLRPDLVHTNSLKAAFYGGLASRLAGIPVVSHVHDRLADDYLPPRAAQLARRVLHRFPHAVLAPSQMVADTLGRPATVIPNIVFESGRRENSVPERPLTVGMVGRITRWKGQHVFIEAFAQAFPNGEERALIVGAPLFGREERQYLEELHDSAAANLTGRVHFEGFVDDIEAFFAEIDVLVHASVVPEPFGLVVLEGMAAGLPVIAADAGGPAEFITNRVDGLLYPPGDAAALAERLRMLARDSTLRLGLGEAARRRAEDYAPEAIADRMRGLYDEVLREKPGADRAPVAGVPA
jgi:glycosyltransferase involved in cell wall biosynthesis